jgi:hypothetical protein
MSVKVHIEHLVLDGFPISSADGRHVKAALQRELSRLLASDGTADRWRASGAAPSAPAAAFDPSPTVTPSQLGTQIAQSVHRAIAGPQ